MPFRKFGWFGSARFGFEWWSISCVYQILNVCFVKFDIDVCSLISIVLHSWMCRCNIRIAVWQQHLEIVAILSITRGSIYSMLLATMDKLMFSNSIVKCWNSTGFKLWCTHFKWSHFVSIDIDTEIKRWNFKSIEKK